MIQIVLKKLKYNYSFIPDMFQCSCTISSGGTIDQICHLLTLPCCVIHMFTSLPVTIVFTINWRWLYKLFNKFLDMVHVCVELSINMAVLCGTAGKHLIVPIRIRPHCGAVWCASACCPVLYCAVQHFSMHELALLTQNRSINKMTQN